MPTLRRISLVVLGIAASMSCIAGASQTPPQTTIHNQDVGHAKLSKPFVIRNVDDGREFAGTVLVDGNNWQMHAAMPSRIDPTLLMDVTLAGTHSSTMVYDDGGVFVIDAGELVVGFVDEAEPLGPDTQSVRMFAGGNEYQFSVGDSRVLVDGIIEGVIAAVTTVACTPSLSDCEESAVRICGSGRILNFKYACNSTTGAADCSYECMKPAAP